MAEDMPKRVPCKVCGRKPKHEIIAWGYGDSNDEHTLICTHGKRNAPDYVRIPNPLKQFLKEIEVVKLWNAITP